VLVLLRGKALPEAWRAVRAVKASGRKAWISWKESGLHQVAEALREARRYEEFRTVCGEADGFVASTPDLVCLYRAAGCERGEFVPTPYPVEEETWNFGRPLAERAGIFIGTREFDVPTRSHLSCLASAATLGVPVTVVNSDGSRGAKMIRAVSSAIRVVEGPLAYPDYLRLMASHRLVLQFDRSAVPGQVAGDALLCRVPCVGGDGAIERTAFPGLCGHGRSQTELAELARRLLADDRFVEETTVACREIALRELSFTAVARRLESL